MVLAGEGWGSAPPFPPTPRLRRRDPHQGWKRRSSPARPERARCTTARPDRGCPKARDSGPEFEASLAAIRQDAALHHPAQVAREDAAVAVQGVRSQAGPQVIDVASRHRRVEVGDRCEALRFAPGHGCRSSVRGARGSIPTGLTGSCVAAGARFTIGAVSLSGLRDLPHARLAWRGSRSAIA